MDIEKAKEVLNRINNAKRFDGIYTTIDIIFEAIEVLLNELDKKEKIINAMGKHIEKGCDFDSTIQTKEQVIDYFTKKAEGK